MHDLPEAVLVTGGAGFLGSYVVSRLHDAGTKAVIFDRAPPSAPARFVLGRAWSSAGFIQGDVTVLADLMDAARRHGVGGIVHLAAQQDIEFADAHPIAAYRTNILGTMNALETARLLGLGRMVISSSMAALVTPRDLPVTETSATFDPAAGHPTGHYGASKVAVEVISLAYHGAYGTDVVLLRFPSIYGFGSPHRIYVSPAIEAAVRGEPIAFGTGEAARRDFLYVKDAASAVLCAMTTPRDRLAQRLFLIATGCLSTAADVVRAVCQVVPGARITVGPGQTPLEARVAPIRVQYDASSARLMLGFAPQYDLKAGVADYVSVYREHLAGADAVQAGASA